METAKCDLRRISQRLSKAASTYTVRSTLLSFFDTSVLSLASSKTNTDVLLEGIVECSQSKFLPSISSYH